MSFHIRLATSSVFEEPIIISRSATKNTELYDICIKIWKKAIADCVMARLTGRWNGEDDWEGWDPEAISQRVEEAKRRYYD